MIHDQIVIVTTNGNIREKAMIKNWNLTELHQKGMKYKSTVAGEGKISGYEINKVGDSSYQRIRNEKKKKLPTKNATDGIRYSVLNT